MSASTTKSPKKSLKIVLSRKWLRFAVPLIFLLLIPGGIGARLWNSVQRSPTTSNTQPVERQTIAMTISANGTVNAERSINLSPKSAGVIKTLLIKEGDRVRQGQVLAIMDDSNLQGQLVQMRGQLAQQEANLQRLIAGNRPEDIAKAEAQLAEARANLQQLKSGNRPQEIGQASARLQQARATLKLREADLQRYQQLQSEGAITKQTLDQKLTDRDVAKTQAIEAEQALGLQNAGTRPEQIVQAEARVVQQEQTVAALKAGNRIEDIAQARAQVESARGSLQTIQAQLGDTKVVAPFAGVVTKTYADTGAFVSPSMAGGGGVSASSSSILSLSSDRNYIVTHLSESQIRNIKPGQTVTIKADAFPGESFAGKVATIAPQATVSQNVTSFEVKVAISAVTDKLKPGMNVEAQLEIGSLENALLVPNAAVVRQAEGQGVYILGSDRQPVFQKIQTGITAQGQTEVKSGLQGGEQVLVNPPTDSKKTEGLGFPPRAQ
jgi:HlyD family secretion protein